MKKPRDYQSEAVDVCFEELKNGCNRQLIVFATGLGKTFTATSVAKRAKRLLWLTHREELIEQSALAFCHDILEEHMFNVIKNEGVLNMLARIQKERLYEASIFNREYPVFDFIRKNIGIIKRERNDINARFIFASIQSLYRRLDSIPADHFDYIIVDEAHLSMAPTWTQCIDHFDFKLLLGLTATPKRLDGLSLTHLFDKIVVNRDISYGIQNGWLVEIDAVQVKTQLNISAAKNVGGDFSQKDLEVINCPERNGLIVEKYVEYANGTKAIGFCNNVQHAIDLAKTFNDAGISASFVCADESICPDRKERLSLHKSGEIKVMLNVDILTAGYDDPSVVTIIQATPTQSLVKYLQSTGRGTRPLPGIVDGLDSVMDRRAAIASSAKPKMILLDIVDLTSKHSLVNSWTLDQDKEIEQKVFITEETRESMIAERIGKMEALRDNDRRVDLLSLPKHSVLEFAADRMRQPATEAQIETLKRLGVYEEGSFYTKGQCTELISSAEATEPMKEILRRNGYDLSMGCTFSQANEALRGIRENDAKRVSTFKGLK